MVIPGITAEELEDFLDYFFESKLVAAPEVLDAKRQQRRFANLFRLGHLWDMEETRKVAREGLEGLPLKSATVLHYARCFHVPDWVDPVVRRLLCPVPISRVLDDVTGSEDRTTVPQLTNDDACTLGGMTINILYQAYLAIQHERNVIAYAAPRLPITEDMDFGDCSNHTECIRILPDFWFRTVGRKVLHPKSPLPLKEIGAYLRNHGPFPGMTPKCYADMVAKWEQNCFGEEAIIDAAVKGIQRFNSFYGIAVRVDD
ncbi:hypothetical protein FB45DRAFT_867760 [Roridomyces roridus]|uniref:Uncharacterized protein n=1 Tax=Roridomyces roridus TaxID=1738132 RepID=A0AAD7BRP5_9AGAR|nr:hypothetical protein FB45DRAFT_867760 [Roridomyces roridus]